MSEDQLNRVMFLWAAIGARDEPPSRVEVFTCPRCGALVPQAEHDRHGRWHAR